MIEINTVLTEDEMKYIKNHFMVLRLYDTKIAKIIISRDDNGSLIIDEYFIPQNPIKFINLNIVIS